MSDDPPTVEWLDLLVGAPAWETLLRHLARGSQRIVVWGPAGAGKRTLLERLRAHEAGRGVELAVASDLRDARARLERAAGPLVLATPARAGIVADAYVECAPLALDGEGSAIAFLARLIERDGAEASDLDELRRVARHTEGLPRAVRRAAELLRLMSAGAIAERCDAVVRELLVHGRLAAHPLHEQRSAELDDLDAAAWELAVVLLAAGEPLLPAELEDVLGAPPLDALLGLRDRSALRVEPGGRVHLTHVAARAVAAREGFDRAFERATRQQDERAVAIGGAARARWVAVGDEGALSAIDEHAGRLRRAAERALAGEHHDAEHAARRIAAPVLALRTSGEVRRGPRAEGELVERALAALRDTDAPPLHALCSELALERAHCARASGDHDLAERVLLELEPQELPPAAAARWYMEHAQILRQRRELDDAWAQLERALALTERHGPAHTQARITIELGSVRFWQQRFDEAVTLYDRGRALAAHLDAARTEAIALSNLCLCASLRGDEVAASRHGEEAVARFRAIGDVAAIGTTLGHLGILAYQYGRFADATRRLEEAQQLVDQVGTVEHRIFIQYNRAHVAFGAGRLSEAEALLHPVPAMLGRDPSLYVLTAVARLEAELSERRGRLAEARAALERGLERTTRAGQVEGTAELAAHLARVLARLGEHGASAAASERAAEALRALMRPDQRAPCELLLDHAAYLRGESADTGRLSDAMRPLWAGLAARTRIGVSAADSGSVREAAALFFGGLSPAERVAVEWAARDPMMSAVCLDDAGERARLPGGELLEASSRRNAHRLLTLLAEAGEAGAERDALIEGMWPGENIRDDAAANRLHNALAQLRSVGLAAQVAREGTRYRLTGVEVVQAGRVDPFGPSP